MADPFDLRALRKDPEPFKTGWNRRDDGLGDRSVERIMALDGTLREAVTAKQGAESERNAKSKQVGKAKASGDEALFEQLRADVAEAKSLIERAGAEEEAAKGELTDLLFGLPNLPLPDVPDGGGEQDNVEASRWGDPRELGFQPKDHVDLGEGLGGMDFETAAKMSGARFVVLTGQLARLERALAAFMLDVQTGEHGYTEVSPPLLVKDVALLGTGQLPKFEEDLFKTGEGFYTTPTAEVPLTNTVREQILPAADLPMRLTAHTPCFRSEAGSAGRDTRGMIRLHQFNKVELVSVVRNEAEGLEELERMTRCAETILERLELPYRRMLLCTGDMGFGARKTYDLEVWLPAQDQYREISSCSYCGDFQGRRMDARWRPEPSEDTPKPKPEFVHTLNGSGLAVGRTLVAVLENHQNEDGSITIPDVLRGYMGGLDRITP